MSDKVCTATGIIGGTGFYSLEMDDGTQINETTPFGQCTASCGHIGKSKVVFIPRHGKHHDKLPHEVNYRANIYTMKKLGVKRVFAFCMVGSLKKEISPGDIVIPDQYIDLTHGRSNTFFGCGNSVYVSMADPFCRDISSFAAMELQGMGISVHRGGIYICINGPHFSTMAESQLYAGMGDIVGMTTATEAKLAREAGLCYCVIASVVDKDTCGMGMKNMRIIIQNAKKAAISLAEHVPSQTECKCSVSLSGSIVNAKPGQEFNTGSIKSMFDFNI